MNFIYLMKNIAGIFIGLIISLRFFLCKLHYEVLRGKLKHIHIKMIQIKS